MIRLAILSLIIVSSVGCYSNPAYQREIAILRGEIIDLENKYYALKSDHEMATAELANCRSGNCPPGNTYYSPSNSSDIGNQPTPVEELPKSSNPESDDNGTPMIEDGDVTPKTSASNTGYGEQFSNGELTIDSSTENDVPVKTDPQSWVKKIRVAGQLSHGEDFDGKSGDDGIVLVVQPLDQQGNVVTVAADLTVSVIDPRESGRRQFIALHRLKRQEVKSMLESSEEIGAGIHVRIPWNSYQPRNEQLRVFVRFQTSDNRKLETNTAIKISLPKNGDQLADQQRPIRSKTPALPASSSKSNWRPRR